MSEHRVLYICTVSVPCLNVPVDSHRESCGTEETLCNIDTCVTSRSLDPGQDSATESYLFKEVVHTLRYQLTRSLLPVNCKLFSQKWLPSLIATTPEAIAFIWKAFSTRMHLLLILVDPTNLLKP